MPISNSANQNLSSLSATVVQNSNLISQQGQNISTLNQTQASQAQTINSQGTQLTNQATQLSTQAGQISSLQGKMTTAEQQIVSHNGRIATLEARTALTYRFKNEVLAAPKVWIETAVMNSTTGEATFTLPAGYFTAIHAAAHYVFRNTQDITRYVTSHIRTENTNQIIVQVGESKTTGIIATIVSVEGLEKASGTDVTVKLVVFGV